MVAQEDRGPLLRLVPASPPAAEGLLLVNCKLGKILRDELTEHTGTVLPDEEVLGIHDISAVTLLIPIPIPAKCLDPKALFVMTS